MNVKGIIDMDGSNIGARNTNWVVKDHDISDSSSIGSISEDSMNSVCSSNSESELAEDASSSSSSSSSHSNGPLYQLSELMNHLPIKRGLSMYYQGKAQSFTSLAMVQSIEDLPKKESGFRKKMKSCKSYGGGLDGHRVCYTSTPKATISKKANSRGSFVSVLNKRGSFHGESRLSSISVHKNF